MAKQRRMAALTAGLLAQAVELPVLGSHWSLLVTVALIAAGALVTCITRTRAISRALENA